MIRLKKAYEKDAHLVLDLQKKAFEKLLEKYQDEETNPGAECLDKILNRMRQAGTQYYFIFKHEIIIGAARVHTENNQHRLSPIFILPEYQGQGYGQAAMYLLESLYPYEHWVLSTIMEEEKLVQFYEKVGYTYTHAKPLNEKMTAGYFEKKINPLKVKDLLYAIEKSQLDHELSQLTEDIEVSKTEAYCMIKHDGSNSLYSNRVVYAHEAQETPHQLLQIAKKFYGEKEFSWWTQGHVDENIQTLLKEKGFCLHDRYDALYKSLESILPVSYNIREVMPYEDSVKDLAILAVKIWEGDENQIDYAIKRYNHYLTSENRRGGYILVYKDQVPVGYGNYRFSSCQRFLYLNGTGVLPEYRRQGYYTALLNYRLNLGKKYLAQFAVVQARQNHSSPILLSNGFKKIGEFELYA
ncbi:MAG: GNAT family N-acetyltransferase [Clostridia bacterium]|nr:GNAT family N-acetyltransferase [Clostridia bacterium]